MNRHTQLCREIMIAIGAIPGVIVGANPTGLATYTGDRGSTWRVHYGWPSSEGGPDLLAVVAPLGRLVALEVKTGSGRARPEQRAVHAALAAVGAVVAVVRSVDEARAAIEKARRP